ncbi:MAG: thiamine pyrophosphate-dependent dehydrogenase E1 component subunit alpha [Burkholderiales bacterium]|nr:thiamine pyrophosphate-dependent dehydrogenase E1 component subunit alpha [Burkholderiales bacterium]
MPTRHPAPRHFDVPRYRDFYRTMWRIRLLEEAAIRAVTDKLVLGAIHPSIGQEAVAVGVCGNLAREDALLSTHRGHGHTLAKGADSLAMMRELFGREGGTCHGKGGSMHIADFGVGMLGANGVVGANIVIAVGAAHAIRLKRENRIVCCLFGDGAINRGPFLEGLNWAGVWQLPVLFVCEDNGFAASTRTRAMTAGEGPAARARAFGIAAEEVDGNDAVLVDQTAQRLIGEVRGGGGPRFLVARTYRLSGHTGVDPAAYRPKEEVEAKWRDDPIARLGAALISAGLAQDELEADRRAAYAEMERAYATAREAPWPPQRRAFEDVQDAGDPRVAAF